MKENGPQSVTSKIFLFLGILGSVIVVAVSAVAIFVIYGDRPQFDTQSSPTAVARHRVFSIGTTKGSDFENATFFDVPAIAVNREDDGTWHGLFAATALPTQTIPNGTFAIVLPIDTAVRVAGVGLASNLKTEQWSEFTIVRVSFGLGNRILLDLDFPRSFSERSGYGRERFRLFYLPRPKRDIPEFVPLRPLSSGPDRDSVDIEAASRPRPIPARVGVRYREDKERITETTPDPTGGLPGSRLWSVESVQGGIVIEGVLENPRKRWWIDRAPDFLLAVFGLLLAGWVPWMAKVWKDQVVATTAKSGQKTEKRKGG